MHVSILYSDERFLQYERRILFNSRLKSLYASKLSASLFSPHVLLALHVPNMYFAIDLILQHIVYICNSTTAYLT